MPSSPSVFLLTAFNLLVPGTLAARAQVCVLPEVQKLTTAGVFDRDQFGRSVAISDNWAVVGMPGDDVAGYYSGSVYVFRRSDNGTPSDPSDDFWIEEDKFTGSNTSGGDLFGTAVAISGDRAVVGAYRGDDGGADSGSAYVFRLDDLGTPTDPGDDLWIEKAKLTAADSAAGDSFGASVAIRGDYAVVGARGDDDAGDGSGSAYVFRRDDNGTPMDPGDDLWIEEAKLTASDAAAGVSFGSSVSISSDRAVVGACNRDSAYVFRRSDNGTPSDPTDDSWVQESKLTASDAVAGDWFGCSVSISGDRVVVGAPFSYDEGAHSGSAYVFRRDNNGTPLEPADDVWVEEVKLTAPTIEEGRYFGLSVLLGNELVIIGAQLGDWWVYCDPRSCGTGVAYVFRRRAATWVEVARGFSGHNPNRLTDGFAGSMSISGDVALIGAAYGGAAYVFDLTDSDGDGVLDKCCAGTIESPLSPPMGKGGAGGVATNRFLPFSTPTTIEAAQAVRVVFASLISPFDGLNGRSMWVGEPVEVTELSGVANPALAEGHPTFWAATLQCEPFYADWTQYGGTIHVYHESIIPGSVYDLQAIRQGCGTANEASFSAPLTLGTSAFGNVSGPFDPQRNVWTEAEPEGAVDTTTDVIAAIEKFGNSPGAPVKVRVDLDPETPDFKINIIDIVRILDAFRGLPYPFAPTTTDPCG